MATAEQDVPLDSSRDKPTLTGCPCVPLPKGLLERTAQAQVGDKWCLCLEADLLSSEGSVAEMGDTCTHSFCSELAFAPSALQTLGRRAVLSRVWSVAWTKCRV